MKFLRQNIWAITLVIFVILSEIMTVLPFLNWTHTVVDDYAYTAGEMLYYFVTQFGYVSFLPSLILYLKEEKINSKLIYLGLLAWNGWEMLQEINMLFKFDIGILSKVDVFGNDILQIICIIFIVSLTFYAHKKWNA